MLHFADDVANVEGGVGQEMNGFGSAGEEGPLGSGCAVVVGEGGESGWGVVIGIDGEGDQVDVGIDLLGELLHARGHHGAFGGAGGVDEVGDPDFAGEFGGGEGVTGGVGHGEGRDGVVAGEFVGAVRAVCQ